jgi:5'-deoxynucleotidase YfbR-like HD superfamily hydrolase
MSLGLEDKMSLKVTEKRVGDMATSLPKLIEAIKRDEQADAKILAALQQNNQAFSVFLDKFKEYLEHENTPEEPPKINVNTQQEKVVAAITEQNKLLELISNNQKSIIELVGKKPTRLNVTRNDYGTIKYVEIQY